MLMPSVKPLGELENASEFIARHIGISEADEAHMLSVIGEASRRARERAIERFGADAVVGRYLALYERVLAEAGG